MAKTSFGKTETTGERLKVCEYHWGAVLGVLDRETNVSVFVENNEQALDEAKALLEGFEDSGTRDIMFLTEFAQDCQDKARAEAGEGE